MSQFLSPYIARLLIGGFVVFCVMAVAGKGSGTEPLRLCCACFMVVLILTPYASQGLSLSEIISYFEETEEYLSNQVNAARNATYDDINLEVEEYLKRLISQSGDTADVKAAYSVDEKGAYGVDSVTIYGQITDKPAIARQIAEITGVELSNVFFER